VFLLYPQFPKPHLGKKRIKMVIPNHTMLFSGPAQSHTGNKYRDDLDNYYDDEDSNPGSLMPTEASPPEPEEEEQPPVPRPYRCSMKPNVSRMYHIPFFD
jgi:hypothetical protein